MAEFLSYFKPGRENLLLTLVMAAVFFSVATLVMILLDVALVGEFVDPPTAETSEMEFLLVFSPLIGMLAAFYVPACVGLYWIRERFDTGN